MFLFVFKDHNQHILFPIGIKRTSGQVFLKCIQDLQSMDIMFWKNIIIIFLAIQRNVHLSDRLLLFQVKNPLNGTQSVYENWLEKFPASDGRTPKWVVPHYFFDPSLFFFQTLFFGLVTSSSLLWSLFYYLFQDSSSRIRKWLFSILSEIRSAICWY